MARGASFDVDLQERVGETIAKEIRAVGGNYYGGVCTGDEVVRFYVGF